MAYDYDINGSYLYELSKMPDIRRGEFVHAQGNDIPDKATLGVANGILTTDATLHPFMVDINGVKMTPISRFQNTSTLFDIKFMREYNLATFDISEAWYWIPDKGQQYEIYRGAMMYLWNQKANTEGMKRQIVQRIYSSLTGKQLEGCETGKFGKMFNPFIPAHVQSASRIHVVKTCLDYKVSPIAITGDGFVCENEVIGLKCSDELGGWKLKQVGKCLSIGSNVIIFKDGKNSEDYELLMEQVKTNPKLDTYAKKWYSPISLPVALQQDWEGLGNLHRLDRAFSVTSESKRLYPTKPKNCGDLVNGKYNSLPWNYDVLEFMADKIKVYEDDTE